MLNLKYLDHGMLKKCKQILMRPMLKKQFEDDVRTVFSAYKGQGAVEDFRDLVTETLGTSWRRNFPSLCPVGVPIQRVCDARASG